MSRTSGSPFQLSKFAICFINLTVDFLVPVIHVLELLIGCEQLFIVFLHLSLQLCDVILCQTSGSIAVTLIPGEPYQVSGAVDACFLEVGRYTHQAEGLPTYGAPHLTVAAGVASYYQ